MGEGIMRLGYVHIRTTDLEASRRHYRDVMGMQETACHNDRVYFKCWDEYDHHSVVVQQSDRAGLEKMGFKVHTYEDLDALEKQVMQHGAAVTRFSEGENDKVGQGIRFEIPSGHVMELYVEM